MDQTLIDAIEAHNRQRQIFKQKFHHSMRSLSKEPQAAGRKARAHNTTEKPLLHAKLWPKKIDLSTQTSYEKSPITETLILANSRKLEKERLKERVSSSAMRSTPFKAFSKTQFFTGSQGNKYVCIDSLPGKITFLRQVAREIPKKL